MSEQIKLNTEDLQFKDSDNTTEKAILGTLEGPCADFIDSTRNGRKYSESLWEKVFSDPIIEELIDNGGIPGELDHPADREDVDSSRIAILLKDKPIKKNGKLWAKFSILNTPLGKIAYTLAKAGFKLGISSRGSGDVITNSRGEEEVDESTYDFKCFDLVLIPAVKSARLNLVTESLHKDKKISLQESFSKIINESTEDEKKLIKETISNLGLNEDIEDDNIELSNEDIKQSIRNLKAYMNESLDDELTDEEIEKYSVYNKANNQNENSVYDIEGNTDEEAETNSSDLIGELQEIFKKNEELENQVISLQEKLSACYAKEAKYSTESTKLKEQLKKFNQTDSFNSELQEKISKLSKQLEVTQKQLSRKTNEVKSLSEELDNTNNKCQSLNETLKSRKSDNLVLQGNYKALSNKLNEATRTYNIKCTKLAEEYNSDIDSYKVKLEQLTRDLNSNKSNYSKKIEHANNLVEKYKKIANRAVDKYIDSQAIKLGVSINEIKNKLPESYSFTDIDTICENLSQYKLNVSKLPFGRSSTLNENVKLAAKPSQKEPLLQKSYLDDNVDSDLLRLAGLD